MGELVGANPSPMSDPTATEIRYGSSDPTAPKKLHVVEFKEGAEKPTVTEYDLHTVQPPDFADTLARYGGVRFDPADLEEGIRSVHKMGGTSPKDYSKILNEIPVSFEPLRRTIISTQINIGDEKEPIMQPVTMVLLPSESGTVPEKD